MCHRVVTNAEDPISCAFETASKRVYSAALACNDIDGWFYVSAEFTDLTALDNGGSTFEMALTYGQAFDVHNNNEDVLLVACAVSKALEVPAHRVTDSLGGYCGVASALVTPVVADTTADTTTTDDTTTADTTTTDDTTTADTTTTDDAARLL